MSWIENQVRTLESRFEVLLRQVQDLYQQVYNASQSVRNANQGYQGGGSGGSGGYTAYPGSIINAGASASLAVTQWTAGTGTVIGTFTCYNIGSSSTVAGNGTSTFALLLVPDNAGDFNIYDQCCS